MAAFACGNHALVFVRLAHDRRFVGAVLFVLVLFVFIRISGRHRVPAGDLNDTKEEFARLNIETSRGVLRAYQSRKNATAIEQDQRRLPQLHAG